MPEERTEFGHGHENLSKLQEIMENPWTAAHQASLSFTISQSLCKLISIELVVPSNHLTLCCPLLLFLASGSFLMNRLFTSGSQSIGVSASASVLPKSSQGWFPLGLTSLISFQSKGLSRLFSNTTVQEHHFFGAQLSLWSNSYSIHDYWKNYSFDNMDLGQQSNISAF